MSMVDATSEARARRRGLPRRPLAAALPAAALGAAAALLVSCGGGSAKLIPAESAGPLQTDFEEVAQDAQTGNGSCTATEAALLKTQQDFAALPSSIDSGLRERLSTGISNLHTRALSLCSQPLAQTATTGTTTAATSTATTTDTTPTVTQSTSTDTTPATTTPTNPDTTPGGGTPAPKEEPAGIGGGTGAGESDGNGNGNGNGK